MSVILQDKLKEVIFLAHNFTFEHIQPESGFASIGFGLEAVLQLASRSKKPGKPEIRITQNPGKVFSALLQSDKSNSQRLLTFAAGTDRLYEALHGAAEKYSEPVIAAIDRLGRFEAKELKRFAETSAMVSIPIADPATGLILPFVEIADMAASTSDAIIHLDATAAAANMESLPDSILFDFITITIPPLKAGDVASDVVILQKGSRVETAILDVTEPAEYLLRQETSGQSVQLRNDLRRQMRDCFELNLKQNAEGILILFSEARRLVNTSAISVSGVNGESLAALLAERGVYAVPLSLCSRLPKPPLPIFAAAEIPFAATIGAIHFSFGLDLLPESMETAALIVAECIGHLRKTGV